MKLLIIESDQQVAQKLCDDLKIRCPYFSEYLQAHTFTDIRRMFEQFIPDLVLMCVSKEAPYSFDVFRYVSLNNRMLIVVSDNPWDAVEAIKLKAMDFLLQPFDMEDLEFAVEKASALIRLRREGTVSELDIKPISGDIIVVWDKDRIRPVEIGEIVKIKSSGAYSEIFLDNEKHYVSAKNLGFFEEALKQRNFIRIHHSCMVNLEHIKYYNPGARAYVTLSDSKIEYVSKRKKKDLLKYFNAG